MKMLAVKDIEKNGNIWMMRYTRLTRGGVEQGAVFLCDTQEEAREKHDELMDILQNHNGQYVGRKEKRKLKASRSKPAKQRSYNV